MQIIKRMFKRTYFDLHSYVSNKVISRPARLLMIAWFAAGMTFILGGIFPSIDVNPAISQSPITEDVLGVLLMLGASLMSCSTLNWRNESTAWRLELIALPILISAWLMYTLLILLSDADSLFPISLGVGFIAYCAMRFYEVNRFIRMTRKHVSTMNGEDNA